MLRSLNSYSIHSAVVLTTLLTLLPTSIHAQTNFPGAKDPLPQATQTNSTQNPTKKNLTANSNKPVAKPTSSTASNPQPPTAAATSPTPSATKPTTQPATTAATSPTPSLTKPGSSVAPVATGTGSTVTPTLPKQPKTSVSTNSPPVIEDVQLVLNLKDKRVYVYKGDKIVNKYPVAIGKKGWETPVGEWQVMEKVTNPGWTSFKNGSVIKPGPKNPLGERWIGFWTDGKDVIGFHGTPDPSSIGKAVSHGCVRMYNKDVKELFPLVKVGTTVKVVAQ